MLPRNGAWSQCVKRHHDGHAPWTFNTGDVEQLIKRRSRMSASSLPTGRRPRPQDARATTFRTGPGASTSQRWAMCSSAGAPKILSTRSSSGALTSSRCCPASESRRGPPRRCASSRTTMRTARGKRAAAATTPLTSRRESGHGRVAVQRGTAPAVTSGRQAGS